MVCQTTAGIFYEPSDSIPGNAKRRLPAPLAGSFFDEPRDSP